MTRKEQIKNAYHLTGGHAGFYDGMYAEVNVTGVEGIGCFRCRK